MGCCGTKAQESSESNLRPAISPTCTQRIQPILPPRQEIESTREYASQAPADPFPKRRARAPIPVTAFPEEEVPESAAVLQQQLSSAQYRLETRSVGSSSSQQKRPSSGLVSRVLRRSKEELQSSLSKTDQYRRQVVPEPQTRSFGSSSSERYGEGSQPVSSKPYARLAEQRSRPSVFQTRLDTIPIALFPSEQAASSSQERGLARQSPPEAATKTSPKRLKPPPAPSTGARFRRSLEIGQMGYYERSGASASRSVSQFSAKGVAPGCRSRGHLLLPRHQCEHDGCVCKQGCSDPECYICNPVPKVPPFTKKK